MHSGPGVRRVGGSGNIGTFPVENQRREVFVIGKSRRVKRALNTLRREDLVSTEKKNKSAVINRDRLHCVKFCRAAD